MMQILCSRCQVSLFLLSSHGEFFGCYHNDKISFCVSYRVKFEILLQVVSTSFTVIIVSIVRLHM